MFENVWQNPESFDREQTKEITAEVEGNHSNLKENQAEKEHFTN